METPFSLAFKLTVFQNSAGEFHLTSVWPFSDQLNHRMREGRIKGKDQDKGQTTGQSVRGSAKERSENRGWKTRRYQGYWMGISMMRFLWRCKNDGWYDGSACSQMGAVVLSCTAFIGLSLPIPPWLCLCSPHCDSTNRLIFLEQWCQLFVPPLPSLFHLPVTLSLPPFPTVYPFSPWLPGSEYCWCPHPHSTGNAPVWTPVCVCVQQYLCLLEEYLPEH